MQANAAQALQTVDFFAIAQETGFENPWLLFDTYLDAVAQECAKLTLPKWQDQLGAADIWTVEHCFKLAESHVGSPETWLTVPGKGIATLCPLKLAASWAKLPQLEKHFQAGTLPA